MSFKKIFCEVFAAAMIFSASILCHAAAEESANAKLARIEIDTYGFEQSGAILDRISRLEKNYSGKNTSGNMNARIDAIYTILYDNSAGPCVLAKINALEWNINHEVRSEGVEKRLAALETAILGKTTEGTFNDRIRALAKGSFGEEILPIAKVQVPANTLIKVETTTPANSKTMQEGDSILFRVVEDIFVDGNLVFVKGLPGEGTVVNVHRAHNIMSNGKIETDFHTVKTFDGQDAKTFAGAEALVEMKAQEMSRGLSLLGQTFSGKYSGVEEVFVRGKNIDLPAGIELYVQIREPILVYGVITGGKGGISIADPLTTPKPVEQIQPPVKEPEGLTDDEKIAVPPSIEEPQPPVEKPKPQPKNDEIIEVYDDVPKPPVEEPEPKPEDAEIIEIYDED